jgi:hypothetical protein
MKKSKLKTEIQSYASMWLTLWRIVAREPGETCELILIVSDRMSALRSARSAARLWKRAAKAYRMIGATKRAAMLTPELDKMREERDAARADLALANQCLDAARADIDTWQGMATRMRPVVEEADRAWRERYPIGEALARAVEAYRADTPAQEAPVMTYRDGQGA